MFSSRCATLAVHGPRTSPPLPGTESSLAPGTDPNNSQAVPLRGLHSRLRSHPPNAILKLRNCSSSLGEHLRSSQSLSCGLLRGTGSPPDLLETAYVCWVLRMLFKQKILHAAGVCSRSSAVHLWRQCHMKLCMPHALHTVKCLSTTGQLMETKWKKGGTKVKRRKREQNCGKNSTASVLNLQVPSSPVGVE